MTKKKLNCGIAKVLVIEVRGIGFFSLHGTVYKINKNGIISKCRATSNRKQIGLGCH